MPSLITQASVRVWNIHGPSAKTFEERYPGFAAWRQTHKDVPTEHTLDTDPASGGSNATRNLKRQRRRKA